MSQANIDYIRNKVLSHQQTSWHDDSSVASLKQAAILLPLAIHDRDIVMVYTRRTDDLAQHAGQVSFPGGIRESFDNTPIDTALRETQEEIGLDPKNVEILGRMPSYPSATGFCVFPVIGYIQSLNGIKENSQEVKRLLCVPFEWLKEKNNSYQADYKTSRGEIHRLWFFKEFDGEIIWGLTAQITLDFINLVKL